jgi:hypothetical protein
LLLRGAAVLAAALTDGIVAAQPEAPSDAPQPAAAPAALRARGAPPGLRPRSAPDLAVDVHGSVDPAGYLEEFLSSWRAPSSSRRGPPIGWAAPVSTIPRLERALDRLGYHSIIQTKREGRDAVASTCTCAPTTASARSSSRATGRCRQDEIVRRLSLRAGQPIPLIGPNRDERIERERQSVLSFLRDQGYLEAKVDILLSAGDAIPAPINLTVKIDHGPGYPLGGGSRSRATPPFPARTSPRVPAPGLEVPVVAPVPSR